jgi:hypothetical protein
MYNPFRWRGPVPLEDLFIYKSGLKKIETPLHERHISLESKRENYPDYQNFLVGDKSQVQFSHGINFLQYRMALFSRPAKYVNFGWFGRTTEPNLTDLDMIEGRKYPLAQGGTMFRRGDKVTINPNQPGHGAIFLPYQQLRQTAQGLKGSNRITNAGNTYITGKLKETRERTAYDDQNRMPRLNGR